VEWTNPSDRRDIHAMSLLDDALGIQRKPGSPCKLDTLRQDDPNLHAEIMEALAAPVHAIAVSRALRDRGVSITGEALQRHRRNECSRCR
jgi:hypothetical protein